MEIEATTASLRPYKGTISLFAPDLPLNHDLEPGHVTLLTPAEYKTLNKPTVTSIYTRLTLDKIYVIGEGGSKDGSVRWKVVVWNKGNIWRKVMGLPPKDFHVTLTAVDDWNVENRLGSLINRSESNALVQRIREIGLEAMNHTIVACGDNHEDFRRQLAELVIVDHPDSAKGFVRHAETSTSFPKLRVLSLAQAVSRQVSLFPLVSPRIERLHESTSCGPSCTADELAGIPEALVRYLTAPWPPCLRESESLRRIFWSHPTVSRDRQIYNGYELPRFFSWVYPFRVAGMSTPRNEDDIDALSEMGFTDILSLTLESPLPKTWFHLKQIKQTFIPLKNYGAPTLAEMDVILERIEAGGTWLVHCGDGVGRAGTALACLVAMFGEGHDTEPDHEIDGHLVPTPRLDAGSAIRLLRTARPRSLESEQQEAFVSQWVSHRWKLLNAVTVSEPVTLLRDSDFQGARIDPANLDGVVLVMIGKPGSGKSWLSECIARRRPSGRTIIISQDECGSRSMCETELARDHPATTLVILDRCNPSREDRMYWLKLTDRRTIAIFFDYDKEVCRHRIDKRLNHPTIRAGKGGNALDQMDKEMKPPTLAERYSSILRISSFTAAREAVLRFTPPVLLRKFPRTPHLMNLGSTTEDDIVLDIFSPATGVLEGNLTIEEKIDGANMGISLGWDMGILTQNRSHWVHAASHAQFKPLDIWLDTHRQTLTNLLLRDEFYPERYILYGEWMVAKHTVHYRALPDRFIAFDMYDRLTSTFLSRSYLEKMLKGTGIQQVPLLASVDGISKKEILDMIQGKSAFGDGRMEGVYVRFEDPERKFTLTRGKVVRGDFIAGNDHWSKGRMVWNELKREYGGREGGEGAQAGEV